MNVKHHVFLVEYVDPSTGLAREFRVRVIMADRLATELHGHKYGLLDPAAQPQLTGFLWLYFAMRRQGDIDEATEFRDFETRCLDNNLLKDVKVPPTPESDASVSDSPSASRSTTGSTPSSAATTG